MPAGARQGSRQPFSDGIAQQCARDQGRAVAYGVDVARPQLTLEKMINVNSLRTLQTNVRSALLLLLLTAGAAGAQRARRDSDRDYRTSVDTSFDFDRRGLVSLTLGSGDIVVTAWSRDQIRIHATSENGGLRLDASGSRVSLQVSSGGDSRYEVTVPVGVRVVARAQSGDVTITGTQ